MAGFPMTWYVGDTHTPLSSAFLDESKNPIDLTGATLSIRFQGPTVFSGSGVFVVTNAALATYTYQPGATDVALANVGVYSLWIAATWPDGTAVHLDPVGPWILVATP